MWGIIVGIFTGIWNAVETVALTIGTIIVTIWQIIRPILNPLWSGVSWAYRNVLKPFWNWATEHLARLKELYDAHVKPIVDRIYSIIARVRKVWNSLLQPAFDTISALQQFLVVTRLNQTAFGKWLDGELGQLYNILNDFDQRFLKPLNAILHVLNEIVLDIDGAFRYAIMVETTGKHMATIATQWWNKSLAPLKSRRSPAGTLPRLTPSPFVIVYDGLVTQLGGGESDLTAHVESARKVFLGVTSGNLAAPDNNQQSPTVPIILPF